MSTERWDRIEDLFEQALKLPAAERAGFVESSCACSNRSAMRSQRSVLMGGRQLVAR